MIDDNGAGRDLGSPSFEHLDLAAPIIECRPGTMGGRLVFRGTRVPVEVLFENLADGLSLAEIVDSYPTLAREDCQAALLRACRLMQKAPASSRTET